MASKKHSKTMGERLIDSYQVVPGFTRVPVAPDGNCFYTATGFFCGANAATMRKITMGYLIHKKAEYSVLFETEAEFMDAVKKNCSSGIWNSDICDIAPHAAAQFLKRDIIIHNYAMGELSEIRTPVESKAEHPPIHLFRSAHHFEILLKNGTRPNKNIYPLVEVAEFYGLAEETFAEEEEHEVEDDENPEVEEDEECMINLK